MGQRNTRVKEFRKFVKHHPRRRRVDEEGNVEMQNLNDLLFLGDDNALGWEEERVLLQMLLDWLDGLDDAAA